MSFFAKYAGLVTVLSKFLNQSGLKDKKFKTADLAVALRLTANDDQEILVDENLINGAFKFDDDRSVVPLHLLIVSLGSNDRAVLYVEKKRDRGTDGKGKGGRRYTTIGVFGNVERAAQVTAISTIGKWSPHHLLITSLNTWLADEAARRQKKRSKKSKNKTARRVSEGGPSPNKRERKRQHTSDPASKEAFANALRDAEKAATALEAALEAVKAAADNMAADGIPVENDGELHPSNHDEGKCTSILHYTLDGVAGTMRINPSGFILGSDLVNNCEKLLYEDTDELRKDRESRQWHLETVGAVQVMVPNRCSIIASNQLSRLKTNNKMVKRLRHLFRGKRCKIRWENMRYLAAFGLHNLGGSVEGLQMAVAATMRMIANEMGFVLTNEYLGIGCPSQEMIRLAYMKFAAECYLGECWYMRNNNVRMAGLLQDAGHKNKLHHHCKLAIYATRDEDGNRRIRRFCIDVDTCGGTAEEICQGIKKSIDRLKKCVPGLKIVSITGDSGGGGKVQGIFDRLVELGVIDDEWGRFIRCLLHALNKCIENATKYTFGDQGLGKSTAPQLLYNALTLYTKVRSMGGLKLLDDQFTKVAEKLNTDEKWQKEAKKNSPMAFAERSAKVAAEVASRFNEIDPEELQGAYFGGESEEAVEEEDNGGEEKKVVKARRNAQVSNFQRWNTLLPASRFVTGHWLEFYFLAVGNRQSQRNGNSYLSQLSDSLLAAMNTKARQPDDGSGEEGEEEIYEPSLYIQLLLLNAFADEFFDDFFFEAMSHDPEYGESSHGQTSRRWVVQAYLLKKKLDMMQKLIADVLDEDVDVDLGQHPSLKKYYDAVETLPELGDVKEAGKEYFMKAPETFLGFFRLSFKEHVEKVWRHQRIVVFTIGDNPVLAQEFLKLLNHIYHGNDKDSHHWPPSNKNITLKNQLRSKYDAEVNVRDFLEYITDVADLDKALSDPFVSENDELLWEMAEAETPVDIHDETTWNGIDYTPIADLIHQVAGAASSQGQMIENHVQGAGRASHNNRGEVMSTCLASANSLVVRSYNEKSVAEKREKVENAVRKSKIKRVKDKERVEGFSDHLDNTIFKQIEQARDGMTTQEYNDFVKDYVSNESKASTDELQALLNSFDDGLQKQRRRTAKEHNPLGIDVTSSMGGSIPFVKITKTRGHKDHVEAEIEERGITLPKAYNEMYEERKGWDQLKDLLRISEFKRLAELDKVTDLNSWAKVQKIVPQSEKMMEIIYQLMEESAAK